MILGITGSSGAGKSTVCEILQKKYNSQTINTDEIAKKLSKPGTNYLQEIVLEFGKTILLEDGNLNRKKLANIIYTNSNKRKKLNNITFKYIKKEVEVQINKSTNNIIAIDAPLLFEAEMNKLCDKTVAVISENINEQIQRIIKRDNIDKEHAIARINAQHLNEFYIQNCDYTLVNNEMLEEQISKLLKNITK